MSSPHYANIIIQSATEIDVLLNVFVMQGYKTLSSFLQKPLGSFT